MERYACAYRDSKSPLTPLTPLALNPMFKFNLGGDDSLDEGIRRYISPHALPEKRPQPPLQMSQKKSPLTQTQILSQSKSEQLQQQQQKKLKQPTKSKTVTKTTKTTTFTDDKTTVTEKTITTTQVKRYSDYFNKLRDVFEKDGHQKNLLYATTAISSTLGVLISSAKRTTKMVTSTNSSSSSSTSKQTSKSTPTYQKCLDEIDTPTPVRTPRCATYNTPIAPHPTPVADTGVGGRGTSVGTSAAGVNIYNTTPHMPKASKSKTAFSNAYRGLKHLRVPECNFFKKSPKSNDKNNNNNENNDNNNNNNNNKTPTKQKELQRENYKKYIRQISPVTPKPLSPRVLNILHMTDLTQYMSLFQREEVDFEVLRLMSLVELQKLGIANVEDQRRLLDFVKEMSNDEEIVSD